MKLEEVALKNYNDGNTNSNERKADAISFSKNIKPVEAAARALGITSRTFTYI